jgi:hypothetical protein
MTDRAWRDADRDRCALHGSAAPIGASAVRRSAESTLDQLLAEPIVELLMHRDRTDETTVRHLLQTTLGTQPASRAKDDPRADDSNMIVRLLLETARLACSRYDRALCAQLPGMTLGRCAVLIQLARHCHVNLAPLARQDGWCRSAQGRRPSIHRRNAPG